MPRQNRAERLKFRFGIDRAGGVAGHVQEKPARARGDRGLQDFGGQAKAVFYRADRHDGCAAQQFDHFGIADEVGSGKDHLVPFVQRGHQGVEDDLLGPVRHGDVIGRAVEAVLVAKLRGDGGPQGGCACRRGVESLTIERGSVGCLDHMAGGWEIGFAQAKVDHVDALRPKGARGKRGGHGGRRFDGRKAACQLDFGRGHSGFSVR